MRARAWTWAALAVLLGCAASPGQEVEPPALKVGLDAYRQWASWPEQRIGQRAYMRSTYDRRGGNEGADASHFLYQEADDFNVSLDVMGKGVLTFVRTNHWHGSPWHYEVDGTDHIITETATDDPVNALKKFDRTVFRPEGLFPEPLAWTWSTTKGADLNWVPIPFERSLRLAYSRTRYGTGYYIYQLYDPSARLSRDVIRTGNVFAALQDPFRPWDGETPPDEDVLRLLERSGQSLVPTGEHEEDWLTQTTGQSELTPDGPLLLLDAHHGRSSVRGIEIDAPKAAAEALGRARLRITWDGREAPSVDAPVALFFGAGTLYNRDDREYLVKGFPAHIRFDAERVHLGCYWPMPFFRSARVELIGAEGEAVPDVKWRVAVSRSTWSPRQVGYFHATYRDIPEPEGGRDMVLLDTEGAEGQGVWSGSFVGMSWIFSHNAVLTTLEGDPRFFFDGSQTPQAYGTGTEEWGGGGDYWGGRTMTLPLAGHPVGAPRKEDVKEPEDAIESAYRFLLADAMPFGNRAVIRLEHGGANESREHYASVVYWYGAPAAALVRTDAIDVGDAESEKAHAYESPEAGAPESLSSRYEWGVDRHEGKETYPELTRTARVTRGTSTFQLALRPDNYGVVLRRTLDYAYPNQKAEVAVADVGEDGAPGAFQVAGTWYLAGSNTCVYSNPREELGATQHNAQTSNRRLRDDEFILPRALTRGRKRVAVRVRFEPVERPLFPGHPVPELGWSELDYAADCWVLPEWEPGR